MKVSPFLLWVSIGILVPSPGQAGLLGLWKKLIPPKNSQAFVNENKVAMESAKSNAVDANTKNMSRFLKNIIVQERRHVVYQSRTGL